MLQSSIIHSMRNNILETVVSLPRKLTELYKLNFFGAIGGVLGFVMAILPTLIPRPALFMGILAGIGFMIFYGLGVLAQKIVYWVLDKPIPRQYSAGIVRPMGWVLVAIIIGFSAVANSWQNEIRQLVGVETDPYSGILLILIGFVAISSLILSISRGIKRLYAMTLRRTARLKRLPKRVAMLLGLVIGTFLLITLVNGVFLNTLKHIADNYYRAVNERTGDNSVKPTSPLRSGSDDSLVDWETLGRNGRDFVGSGPTAEDIAGFTGRQALEPIRVYISASQADSPDSRAELAIKELERTGAFNRKYLVISTTTGSGWVEPASAASVEYLHDGDTAQVALQYSYLPSWMALLVSQQDATDSGRALFEAVYAKVQQMPEDQRPKLITSGLSLGAYGSQSAFSSASDFAMRVDGALYFGNPGFSQPWREFTDNRDTGSLQIRPIYDGGKVVRFANNRQDLKTIGDNWEGSRVLYVQYPSDSIVWWTTDLLWHRPDWIDEPKGHDVSDQIRWFPIITFFQITFDQMFGNHFTDGHGHNYAPDVVHSWAAVTPVDWPEDDLTRLQNLMNYRYTAVEPGSSNL